MLPGPKLLENLEDKFSVVWVDSSGQVNVGCPFCHNRGMTRDKSGHLGLNFDKDVAHCVRCDWGRRGLRKWLTDINVDNLPTRFSDTKRALDDIASLVKKPPAEFRHIAAVVPESLTRLREEHFNGDNLQANSLVEKGITPEEAIRHRLCWCPSGKLQKYVVFPFIEDDELVYWQGRHIDPNAKLRKRNPTPQESPLGRKHWLYGFELAEPESHIVLMEGQLDVITVMTWLCNNGGGCSLGLSGTSFSFPDADTHPLNTHFGKLLSLKPSLVTVLFDRDANAKARELAALLASCGLPARAGELSAYKDANDAHGDPEALSLAIMPTTSRLTQAALSLKRFL